MKEKNEVKKPKPLVYRCGTCKLLVWKNEVVKDSKSFVNYSLQFERIYKDGDEWKTISSFDYSHLDTLKRLIDRVLVDKFPIESSEE